MLTNLIGAHSAVSYSYNYSYNATPSDGSLLTILAIVFGVSILLGLFVAICNWKVFQKAGRPGWASIVPIYNTWVILEMGGQPGWWALLSLVPFVNLAAAVFVILAEIEIARRFGKGNGFAALLIFLPIIALPILAFGEAQYTDPTNSTPQGGTMPPQQPPVAPSDPVAPTPADPTSAPVQTLQPETPTQPVEPVAQPQVVEPTNPIPQDPQTPPPAV